MSENNALVIFGATGDLTFQKLLPALNRLSQLRPHLFQKIFLIGRQVDTLEAYLAYGHDRGLDRQHIDQILPKLEYVMMQAGEASAYGPLANKLTTFQGRFFYLATPANLFHVITEALTLSGCLIKDHPSHRCAYEKPFGDSGTAARVLNDLLHERLSETQLYRVDHYLAKPLIQALVKIRFQWQTAGMESLWQSSHIKRVTLRAYESLGILSRGKFYDGTGALKDMVQSHLLETLALLTLDLPARLDAVSEIQQHKIMLIKAIETIQAAIQFGQYEGYLQEANVNPSSITETFVYLPLHIKNSRWRGVDFAIMTGKKLSEKRTDVTIDFHSGAQLIFEVAPNLGVRISETGWDAFPPDALTHLHALTRHPFAHEEAYVTIFQDFVLGNQTLFPTADEISATWRLIDDILQMPRLPIRYRHENDVLPKKEHN
jgi:glucose-6-phosphate 1-dehydrogenase